MTAGTVAFCRKAAADNLQVIESILESVVSPEEKKLYQKELTTLQHAAASLRQIAT
jgi:hypothetical protein